MFSSILAINNQKLKLYHLESYQKYEILRDKLNKLHIRPGQWKPYIIIDGVKEHLKSGEM